MYFGEVAERLTNLPGADLNNVAKQRWPAGRSTWMYGVGHVGSAFSE